MEQGVWGRHSLPEVKDTLPVYVSEVKILM